MHEVETGPSNIEGLGVFAVEAIPAEARIREVNVVREVTAERPLRSELGKRADHCDYPDGKVVLIGEPDRHLNHGCDPNGWILYEPGRCFLVARRDVAPREEITCDYSMNVTGGDTWRCRGGAARCRGNVAGDFFRLPEGDEVAAGPGKEAGCGCPPDRDQERAMRAPGWTFAALLSLALVSTARIRSAPDPG